MLFRSSRSTNRNVARLVTRPGRGRADALPAVIRALLQEIWFPSSLSGGNLVGAINGDLMPVTGADFSGDYIPATSTATFQLPDTATYEACDGSANNHNEVADDLWFTSGTRNSITVIELTSLNIAGKEHGNTLVWYDSVAPHHIRAIGIKKAATTLDNNSLVDFTQRDAVSLYFHLDVYYFGSLSEYGETKENRGIITFDGSFYYDSGIAVPGSSSLLTLNFKFKTGSILSLNNILFTCGGLVSNGIGFQIAYNITNKLYFQVRPAAPGSAYSAIFKDASGTDIILTENTIYDCKLIWDQNNDTIYTSINDNQYTQAFAYNSWTGDSVGDFRIGCSLSQDNYFKGILYDLSVNFGSFNSKWIFDLKADMINDLVSSNDLTLVEI